QATSVLPPSPGTSIARDVASRLTDASTRCSETEAHDNIPLRFGGLMRSVLEMLPHGGRTDQEAPAAQRATNALLLNTVARAATPLMVGDRPRPWRVGL